MFVDVGANIGTPCIPAVAVHGFRRALALEPEPENFRLLRANVAFNSLEDRIDPHRVAASDTTGAVELTLSPDRSGSHSVGAPDPRRRSIGVDAVALDDLLPRLELDPADIGLLWVDVEGHEPEVLRGASTLLHAGVPIVLEARRKNLAFLPLVEGYGRVADLRARGEITSAREVPGLLDGLRGRNATDILLLP